MLLTCLPGERHAEEVERHVDPVLPQRQLLPQRADLVARVPQRDLARLPPDARDAAVRHRAATAAAAAAAPSADAQGAHAASALGVGPHELAHGRGAAVSVLLKLRKNE